MIDRLLVAPILNSLWVLQGWVGDPGVVLVLTAFALGLPAVRLRAWGRRVVDAGTPLRPALSFLGGSCILGGLQLWIMAALVVGLLEARWVGGNLDWLRWNGVPEPTTLDAFGLVDVTEGHVGVAVVSTAIWAAHRATLDEPRSPALRRAIYLLGVPVWLVLGSYLPAGAMIYASAILVGMLLVAVVGAVLDRRAPTAAEE